MSEIILMAPYSLDDSIQRLLRRHENPRFFASRFDRRFDVRFTTATHFEVRRLQKMFRARYGNHMAMLEGDLEIMNVTTTRVTAQANINWFYVLFFGGIMGVMGAIALALQVWCIGGWLIFICLFITAQLYWVSRNSKKDLENLMSEVYGQH